MTAGPHGDWRVVAISTEQTHALRRAVLRRGTPTDEVRFVEDEWPGVVHLGVFDGGVFDRGVLVGGVLVGTSTWVPRPRPERPSVPAVQLRGMATADSHRGRGVGAALVGAGCAQAWAAGAQLVWANARDAALGFYVAHGFEVVGEGFVDATTQLPHHVVERRRP
jgi:GNAT superfamily N-acetyltransferase